MKIKSPKEKAKEIFEKMYSAEDPISKYPMCFDTAKICAIIAIDEIIESSPSLPILSDNGYLYSDIEESKIYWMEVKNELILFEFKNEE